MPEHPRIPGRLLRFQAYLPPLRACVLNYVPAKPFRLPRVRASPFDDLVTYLLLVLAEHAPLGMHCDADTRCDRSVSDPIQAGYRCDSHLLLGTHLRSHVSLLGVLPPLVLPKEHYLPSVCRVLQRASVLLPQC